MKADSMKSIIDNYSVLQEVWHAAIDIVHDSDTVVRINGVASQMQSFDFFFGLVVGEILLRNTDNLSKTLQKKQISACDGQLVAEKSLVSMRNEECFDLLWEKVLHMANDVDVNDPVLPRRKKAPRRIEEGNAPPEYDPTPKGKYRRVYFEAVDLLIQAIADRFDQPGYKMYCCIERLFSKAIQKVDYSNELKQILDVYGGVDLSTSNLAMQLNICSNSIPAETRNIQRDLIHVVVLLAKLVLVMPATNSTSERSFSAMSRVKSYLRSTISQERLNSLMTLHVNKEFTDNIDLCAVGNDFVCRSERRYHIFGKF